MNEQFEWCECWLKNATDKQGVSLEKLYDGVGVEGEKRKVVVDKLLEVMQNVQRLANDNPLPNGMIAIALQDMKTFNMLVNVLVIEGIYPCLAPGINTPLAMRSKVANVPKSDPGGNRHILATIVQALKELLTTKGDVRDILMRGTYTADFLCASLEYGFDPEFQRDPEPFNIIKGQVQTYDLFQFFTSMLRPEAPTWFKAVVSRQLAVLPTMRPNGVRALIEFVSGMRTHQQIDLTELEKVVRVLKTVPKGANEVEFYRKVGAQLITILGRTVLSANSSAGATMKSATLHVVSTLYQEKPEVIKQGFQKQLIERITTPQSEEAVNEGLGALAVLSMSPSDVLTKIQERLIVPLWSLLCFCAKTKRPSAQIESLVTHFINDAALAYSIVKSLMVDGTGEYSFGGGDNGGIEIRQYEYIDEDIDVFDELDRRIDRLMKVLENVDEKVISGVFVRAIRRWLTDDENDVDESVVNALVNVKFLERVSQDHKPKLMKDPGEIVQVIVSVVTQYAVKTDDQPSLQLGVNDNEHDSDSDDEDDNDDDVGIVSLCLSLIAGLAPEIDGKNLEMLATVKPQLEVICDKAPPEVATKAATAMEFLQGVSGKPSTKQDDSQTVLRKAMSSLQDPMVPIRAHGLHLLSSLIRAKDPVMSVDTGLRVLLTQLKDDDSFIYLNSIKALEMLSDVYGADKVVPALLQRYTSSMDIDDRLKAGEVMLRIVQRLDKAFIGTVSDQIVGTTIQMAGTTGDPDERLRNSALSILGVTCEVNPRGLSHTHLIDAVDCALGVLTFEKSPVMRSAAVMLIGSLVKGVDTLNDVPKEFVKQIMTRLRAAQDDTDALVRVQASTTLERIGAKLTG